MVQAQFLITTPAELKVLGQRIQSACREPRPLALVGNLGAGKTTFVQVLATTLAIADSVTSPTFTLINEYRAQSATLIHADLYRLNATEEIISLGLVDYFHAPNTWTVVEWADRAPEIFPEDTLWLQFEPVEDKRVVTIRTHDHQFWSHFSLR